jgi:dTMP kinase
VDLEWCKQPDMGLPEPDLVIFLDLPIEEAIRRGDFGVERYETREFQERVYENFLKLQDTHWKRIDAGPSIEQVQNQLRSLVLQTIRDAPRKPLSYLWSTRNGISSS